jgi:hypothetical protein
MNDEQFVQLEREDAVAFAHAQSEFEKNRLMALYDSGGVPPPTVAPARLKFDDIDGAPFIGWLLFLAGVGCFIGGLIFDPSVETMGSGGGLYSLPERIINTGQLATKTTLINTGFVAMILGAITLGVGALRKDLRVLADILRH